MRLVVLFILLSVKISSQESFTLQQAIDYALQNSPELQMADLDIRDADAQITEFKAIGLPQLNGKINYQYYIQRPVNPVEDFITPSVYQVLLAEEVPGVEPYTGSPEVFEFALFRRNNVNTGVEASWLLFDGSYLSGLKAAKMYKGLTRKAIHITKEELRANVTKAYMNILISEENKKTLSNNLNNIEKVLKETQAYYDAGLIEKLDVSRIELSYENVKTEFEKLDQFIEISYNLLKFQMNYPLTQELALSENLRLMVDQFKITEVDLSSPVDYNNRAMYDYLNSSIQLNEMNIERLRRGYLPSLKANGNYNQLVQRDDLFDSSELGFIPQSSVSLGINIPIYDGARKKGQIQQAQVDLEKVELQKSEFERAMNMQVQNARLQYMNASKTLKNREKSLSIVEDIYDKTSIKFSEGVGSSIELTQAEQQLFEAQGNYINALYDLLISKTDLDIALGNI